MGVLCSVVGVFKGVSVWFVCLFGVLCSVLGVVRWWFLFSFFVLGCFLYLGIV